MLSLTVLFRYQSHLPYLLNRWFYCLPSACLLPMYSTMLCFRFSLTTTLRLSFDLSPRYSDVSIPLVLILFSLMLSLSGISAFCGTLPYPSVGHFRILSIVHYVAYLHPLHTSISLFAHDYFQSDTPTIVFVLSLSQCPTPVSPMCSITLLDTFHSLL
jgi:ABC-type transport system involved in cytochrome c biogenesis permease subunit